MPARAELVGDTAVIESLVRASSETLFALSRAHTQIAFLGESIMKGKVSGRPGPRVVTGDFRRSIRGRFMGFVGTTLVVQVGTNRAQGRRLEYGFVGPDILGRVYNQPPYPYAGPSAPLILEIALPLIRGAVGSAIGDGD